MCTNVKLEVGKSYITIGSPYTGRSYIRKQCVARVLRQAKRSLLRRDPALFWVDVCFEPEESCQINHFPIHVQFLYTYDGKYVGMESYSNYHLHILSELPPRKYGA